VRARAGDACRRRRCSPLACTLAGPLLDFSLFSSPFAFVFTHCASRHFSGSTSSRGLPALCFCFCRRLCTPCVFFFVFVFRFCCLCMSRILCFISFACASALSVVLCSLICCCSTFLTTGLLVCV